MAIARPTPSFRQPLTEEEFLHLPDDGRKYELVDGEAKIVPATVRHDEIGARVIFLFYPYTRGRGALCSSQAGFRMQGGNIRCPDVSFTRKERLPEGKAPEGFGDGAPDLCVEILSSSEEAAEIQRKLDEYFASGATQVWHLFPASQTARVYTSPTAYADFASDQELEGGDLLPGFRCVVADLFAVD